uniref:Nascent polypeptide-associated complex subunit alpha-like UBA domain-containing protein n=1 Tax=Florenciella parvula TaxID=236787 RepID=A0A7S2C0Y6_9STRA|mmetsp:Transcript_18751/g.43649  ORF Transcript_18751/g.43649 Transcript_18751/m.43649 type:complete len:94 (-) Transcript_18751:110-391(-)|eukprot:CAMPEP_0182531568 /NCGR_PEP_ID=MMETSP1323-20130603/9459_1 /TAXON_ID=236787 /ORGANISM="Florenciella parvula, Strain RCC1693" /LENGTH=93 /DNA_ID=CAMNT_0024741151 /DNA_START=44 /DNA_END=325 /DNA_ORIENTATION=+
MNASAANASVEAVTDFHEAKEMDLSKTQEALANLHSHEEDEVEDEDMDMSIKLDPASVATIVDELEVDKEVAEKALRRNKGDLTEALRSLITA